MKEVKITLLTKEVYEQDIDLIDEILSLIFKTEDICITTDEVENE